MRIESLREGDESKQASSSSIRKKPGLRNPFNFNLISPISLPQFVWNLSSQIDLVTDTTTCSRSLFFVLTDGKRDTTLCIACSKELSTILDPIDTDSSIDIL